MLETVKYAATGTRLNGYDEKLKLPVRPLTFYSSTNLLTFGR